MFLGGFTENLLLRLGNDDAVVVVVESPLPATTKVEANTTFLTAVVAVVVETLAVLPSLLKLGLADRRVATMMMSLVYLFV